MYKEKIVFRKLNVNLFFLQCIKLFTPYQNPCASFLGDTRIFYSFLTLPFDFLVLPVVEYIKNKGTSYPICCLRHIPYDIPLSFIKQQNIDRRLFRMFEQQFINFMENLTLYLLQSKHKITPIKLEKESLHFLFSFTKCQACLICLPALLLP